jgi:hypothetical protein
MASYLIKHRDNFTLSNLPLPQELRLNHSHWFCDPSNLLTSLSTILGMSAGGDNEIAFVMLCSAHGAVHAPLSMPLHSADFRAVYNTDTL